MIQSNDSHIHHSTTNYQKGNNLKWYIKKCLKQVVLISLLYVKANQKLLIDYFNSSKANTRKWKVSYKKFCNGTKNNNKK